MSGIKLRPYQSKAVAEIREALGRYRRVLFQAQTAFGKTITFSYIALSSQKYNRKVLILSDRTEILIQNGGALERWGLDIDYISPKHRTTPTKNVSVGMAQTLRRRVDKPEWIEYLNSLELVIIDEAHNATSDFIHDYLPEQCFVLGCTATPRRYGSNTKQLGDMYKAMVTGITTQELIDMGYIAKPRMYAVASPKLDIPIDYSTGDYNRKALAQKFESKTLYRGVVQEWLRICPTAKTICFCTSSRQAIGVCQEFCDNGISAKYVLSNEFDEDIEYSGEREEIFNAFKRGEFQVLVNVSIATAGLDVPDIQCVILNFATMSITRFRQAMGRGCRMCEGKKDFIILDCGDNIRRHGGFTTEQNWCLWHSVSSGEGIQMLKECPSDKIDINHKKGCGNLVPTTCKICPACGFVFLTEKHEYQLYLEEVSDTPTGTISQFCASKKLEGWNFYRILMQVALANTERLRPAIIEAYLTFHPEKTEKDASKFYYVWKKNSWDKIKFKRKETKIADNEHKVPDLFG